MTHPIRLFILLLILAGCISECARACDEIDPHQAFIDSINKECDQSWFKCDKE